MAFDVFCLQILGLGVLLLAAHYGARLSRRLHMGEVVGQILGGLLIGPILIAAIGSRLSAYQEALQSLHFFTFVFLSLIAFGIGDELSLEKLRRIGSKVIVLTLTEALCTWVLITSAFLLLGFDLLLAMLIGSIGIATAPAATFAIMNRLDIGGKMRETLGGMVVLDDLVEITFFSVLCQLALLRQRTASISLEGVLLPITKELGGAIALGILVAIALRLCIQRRWLYPKDVHRAHLPGPEFLSRLISERPEPSVHVFVIIAGCVCTGVGLALYWHLPFLITAVTAGMLISNSDSREAMKSLSVQSLTAIFTLVFFVLIGANADLGAFRLENLLYLLVYVTMRTIGKTAGTWAGCKLSGQDAQLTRTLPQLMLPQTGVAAVEAFYVASVLGEQGKTILGVIIPGIILFAIVGIFRSERALLQWRSWATGESEFVTEEERIRSQLEKNDVLLSDVIRPECLFVPLDVECRGEALWALLRSLQTSGQLESPGRALSVLMDRERQGGIRLGDGVALPHGRLPELKRPVVAMGILPEDRPIDFGNSEEPPVDMIFLTLSPEEPPEAHLKVLSSIARFLSSDDARILLRHAKDGAEAHRLLEKYSMPKSSSGSQ